MEKEEKKFEDLLKTTKDPELILAWAHLKEKIVGEFEKINSDFMENMVGSLGKSGNMSMGQHNPNFKEDFDKKE